jgi:hypothetical protein
MCFWFVDFAGGRVRDDLISEFDISCVDIV